MADQSPEKPNREPEKNPWYLLATLYGVPGKNDDELQARNRVAWNRYMSDSLTEVIRDQIIQRSHHLSKGPLSPSEELQRRHYPNADELSPSEENLKEITKAFVVRSGDTSLEPPDPLEDHWFVLDFDREFRVEGFIFPSEAHFQAAKFLKSVGFASAIFVRAANFCDATFSDEAHYRSTTFWGAASFHHAIFSSNAFFGGATFKENPHALTGPRADFHAATFKGPVSFIGAIFSYPAQFSRADFKGEAEFVGTDFHSANFSSVTFSDTVSFLRAGFSGEALYENAVMKSTTSFSGARFPNVPPAFFGAKLHQDTDWHGINWPAAPKHELEAVKFIRAYECLKQEMDRLKKHEDELNFFARELGCRRVLVGPLRGLPIALYSWLCDYGRSYVRPLSGLLMTVLVGAAPFWQHFHKYEYGLSTSKAFGLSAGLSLANTFGVFGFRKELVAQGVVEGLTNLLTMIAAFQTILGAVLLFLLGLALRNRFRIK